MAGLLTFLKAPTWPGWVKASGTAFHAMVIVVQPVLGWMLITYDELAHGGGTLSADSAEVAFGYAWMLGIAALVSGVALGWTLWGRAPALVRYYAYLWLVAFVALVVPIGMLLAFAALSHPPGGALFVGGMLLMPTAVALVISCVLAFVPAVVLALVER